MVMGELHGGEGRAEKAPLIDVLRSADRDLMNLLGQASSILYRIDPRPSGGAAGGDAQAPGGLLPLAESILMTTGQLGRLLSSIESALGAGEPKMPDGPVSGLQRRF